MITIGIEEEVAGYVHDYTIFLYPGMFIYIQFDTYKQYLNVTAHNTVVLLSNTVSIVVHIYLCHLFTEVMDLPVATVAVAFGISCTANLMILAMYSKFCIEHRVSFLGMFDVKLLNKDKVYEYMAISVPSIVMLCAEWWAMEILSMLAVLLGTIEIAAMTISYNYIFI